MSANKTARIVGVGVYTIKTFLEIGVGASKKSHLWKNDFSF